MNPRVIDDMSWAMAEVYGAVTDKLLVNLARHFKYTKTDNGGTFAYMAQKLAELGQVRKESVDIIMQNLTGADEMLRIVLENAIGYALKDVEPALKQASVKGMLNPTELVPELTPNQTRAFKAYYAQSADKLNLVNTVMLESTEAAYQATVSDIVNRVSRSQSLLNIATGEVVSGASSWNSAVRDAVKGMVENGLTGFIDHGGHRWRPETYVAMDVRTTAFNTAREAVMERNESYGNDLYQVSSHNGARPLCYPWQGKVISSADASREVEDLDGNKVHVYAQSETSYGQAAGLFGVNCGHYPIPFIPGFSRLRGSGQSEEDNAKAYAESQEQRKLERKVRKEKLDLDVMKAQGAGAEEIAAQKQRVRNAQADVSAFCEQTGRARHRDREYLPKDAKWPEIGDDVRFPTETKDRVHEFLNGERDTVKNTSARSTQSTESVVQSTAAPKGTIADVTDFQSLKAYMGSEYGINVTKGVKKLDQQLVKETLIGFESVAKDFPDLKTSLDKIQVGGSGVMSCLGGTIKFKADYFTAPEYFKYTVERNVKSHFWVSNASAGSIGAHETAHAVEMLLIELSGKYTSPTSVALAWNDGYEAADIVSSACQAVQATAYGKGKSNFELIQAISGYAQKGGASETMAEAFADVFANGENANPLSKEIRRRTLDTYLNYKGVNQ